VQLDTVHAGLLGQFGSVAELFDELLRVGVLALGLDVASSQ
jgi:hypothetical protein